MTADTSSTPRRMGTFAERRFGSIALKPFQPNCRFWTWASSIWGTVAIEEKSWNYLICPFNYALLGFSTPPTTIILRQSKESTQSFGCCGRHIIVANGSPLAIMIDFNHSISVVISTNQPNISFTRSWTSSRSWCSASTSGRWTTPNSQLITLSTTFMDPTYIVMLAIIWGTFSSIAVKTWQPIFVSSWSPVGADIAWFWIPAASTVPNPICCSVK